MRKCIKALIIMFLLTSLIPINVKAESVISINELIENAKELDGQEVTVQGEAIGESMERGDYSWININDGTNAIGVWLNKSEADKIVYYGNYKHIGDTVRITATFQRACKEHGGEADLHATSFEIANKGHEVKEHITFVKIISAVILSSLAVLMFILYVKIIRYKKFEKIYKI